MILRTYQHGMTLDTFTITKGHYHLVDHEFVCTRMVGEAHVRAKLLSSIHSSCTQVYFTQKNCMTSDLWPQWLTWWDSSSIYLFYFYG